jgi:hypothetical protein
MGASLRFSMLSCEADVLQQTHPASMQAYHMYAYYYILENVYD